MDLLEGFSRRIEGRLAAARELPMHGAADFEQAMGRFTARLQAFETLARRLMADIISPRMQLLAAYFPDTAISKPGDPYRCTCWFGASGRSPSLGVLALGVDHDARLERLELVYELRVVPAFLPYERQDKLLVDLVSTRVSQARGSAGEWEQIDLQSITAWVEDRLLRFVETYLRLQACGSPSQGETAIDPVCGMLIKKSEAKGLQEHKGHPYYFCSNQCSGLFAATPEQFAQVEIE